MFIIFVTIRPSQLVVHPPSHGESACAVENSQHRSNDLVLSDQNITIRRPNISPTEVRHLHLVESTSSIITQPTKSVFDMILQHVFLQASG